MTAFGFAVFFLGQAFEVFLRLAAPVLLVVLFLIVCFGSLRRI